VNVAGLTIVTALSLLFCALPTAAQTTDTPAEAAPVTAGQCVDAHEKTQNLRFKAELLEARASARLCASESCPGAISSECIAFVRELERDIPTVVFRVVVDGQDIMDATISVDGEVVTERIDGHARDMNPGQHTIRFSLAGRDVVERTFAIRQAEKNQAIELHLEDDKVDVVLPQPVEPVAPQQPSGIHPAAWITGGVGVAGLLVFAGFAGAGWAERGDLEDSCGARCSDDEVASVRTKLVVADVALGVGLAGLVASTILFLTTGGGDDATPDTAVTLDATMGGVRLRF
jgi:hypothetical protein